MGGNAAAGVKDMAAELGAVLQTQVEKGREEWSQLHGKLAEVIAAAGGNNNPRTAIQALLKVAKDAPRALEERVSKVDPGQLKHLILLVAGELNMTPLCDSVEPVHMVDEDSNFCKGNVDRMINSSAELTDPCARYGVVSIIGGQSTGKSYLMNRLFGTRFPVMDAALGWNQTSRGIMMSRCIGPSLVLLDVEGFDGIEKGQDTLFEKQSALFALAVSDLMMVNIRTDDISRHEGSGANLFKTIFKERRKLQGAGFTKILVVLRKNEGETPLEILKIQVLKIMEKIWKDVNNESVKFSDYIEVNIVALPGKTSPDFPTEVTKLRKLLSNNRSAKVPASGFSLSSSIFWDTIKENKELRFQSHQVALARSYCRQLVKDIIKSLDSQKKYKLLKAEESPALFRQISHELLKETKTAYDVNTRKYDFEVSAEERQYLVKRLQEIFKGDSRELIWKVQKKTREQFQRKFDGKSIRNMEDADAYLSKYLSKFMSSFEDDDENVFDSDHLRKINRELENTLQSYIVQVIKEREWKAKEKKDRKNAIIIGVHAVLGAANMGVAIAAASMGEVSAMAPAFSAAMASAHQITASAVRLCDHDSPSTSQDHDSPSTSQDHDCDKSD